MWNQLTINSFIQHVISTSLDSPPTKMIVEYVLNGAVTRTKTRQRDHCVG